MRFISKIFHPNIYPDGRVCISILHAPGDDPLGYETSSERWSPVQSVEKVLLSVMSMLAEPNCESPANVDAAKMWRDAVSDHVCHTCSTPPRNTLSLRYKRQILKSIDLKRMRIADKMQKKLRTFGYLLCPMRAAIYWMQDATLIIHLQYSVLPGDSFSCKFFQNGLLR